MNIEFYLQGDTKPSGEIFVREYFHAVGAGMVLRNGEAKPNFELYGHVDEGVKGQHLKEYARFALLCKEQEDELRARCAAEPGVPIFPNPESKAEIAQRAAAEDKAMEEIPAAKSEPETKSSEEPEEGDGLEQ